MGKWARLSSEIRGEAIQEFRRQESDVYGIDGGIALMPMVRAEHLTAPK
jgi:hypothetical protein